MTPDLQQPDRAGDSGSLDRATTPVSPAQQVCALAVERLRQVLQGRAIDDLPDLKSENDLKNWAIGKDPGAIGCHIHPDGKDPASRLSVYVLRIPDRKFWQRPPQKDVIDAINREVRRTLDEQGWKLEMEQRKVTLSRATGSEAERIDLTISRH